MPAIMHLFALLLPLLAPVTKAADTSAWKTRSIYQLLTDRFARTDGSTTASCPDGYEGYCGGSWQGIIQQLDYIQGMGFDAIWISPITYQIDDASRAYHGYSAKDINQLNPNFGSASDLQSLASALHDREMYLMVDVVPNHMGYEGSADSIDYTQMQPFNVSDDFNLPPCDITDWNNQSQVEICWLSTGDYPLPDLKTTSSDVRSIWQNWVTSTVSTYSVDGIRIDSIKNIETDFWPPFQSAAGVYAVGEAANTQIDYVCNYQNYMDGVLSYGFYYSMTGFFQATSAETTDVVNGFTYTHDSCKDVFATGVFSENHDQPRFGSYTTDTALTQNIITLTMLMDGIPIIYAGQEQGYTGGDDPYDREATWLSGYSTSAASYQLIARLNKIRKQAISVYGSAFTTNASTLVYQDTHTFGLRRSGLLCIYNNNGAGAAAYTVSLQTSGWSAGTAIVDLLTCETSETDGSAGLTVTINAGQPRIYAATSDVTDTSICTV